MNWRYIVGKSLYQIYHAILASKFMPLTRVIPHGISYPYDLKRFSKNQPIKIIFDVGANIGQTSLFLNWYFPQAKIMAFEPINETFNLLKNNTSKIININCFNYALASQEGDKVIPVRENSELNTLVEYNQTISNNQKTEKIQITTINKIGQENEINKIDILKIDVQGYELEVIRGADFYIKNNLIDFIYAEIDFDKHNKECQSFQELNDYLCENNFRFSGFYEIYRWGEDKKYFGFCNALFVNCDI